ncbi:hypothetical protein SAMN06272737_103298 [Blastococcus mobilis]|uniref:Uncharacterized protein n=1 Tax=Blastococcus mobilis TaxID=1938746 RepID=A0A238VKI7_9ACTN|nr:hypothetical protein SAMN06272737_103298 [Blastococcus mobilis]
MASGDWHLRRPHDRPDDRRRLVRDLLAGYATRRPRTVRQAQVHVAQITAAFGPMPLSSVRPSAVRSWTV